MLARQGEPPSRGVLVRQRRGLTEYLAIFFMWQF